MLDVESNKNDGIFINKYSKILIYISVILKIGMNERY